MTNVVFIPLDLIQLLPLFGDVGECLFHVDSLHVSHLDGGVDAPGTDLSEFRLLFFLAYYYYSVF